MRKINVNTTMATETRWSIIKSKIPQIHDGSLSWFSSTTKKPTKSGGDLLVLWAIISPLTELMQ
jgi:hypothetical protein